MTRRQLAFLWAALLLFAHACVSTRPQPVVQPQQTDRGLASWYGQEFAGRTTANGEVFDPLLLTAAHRTLPFGTVLEVKNPKNGLVVMVRVNDRGPFVGDRIIDLSYAAAAKLDLVKTGVGEVEIRVLKVGAGDREPPAPIVVNAGEPTRATPQDPSAPPSVSFPLPSDIQQHKAPSIPPAAPPATPVTSTQTATTQPATSSPSSARPEPVVVDQVEVKEVRGGVETHREVAPDGRTIINAPTSGTATPTASSVDRAAADAHRNSEQPRPTTHQIILQLGAFQSEQNAGDLLRKAKGVTAKAYVEDFRELHRVRVGPFPSRDAALDMKEKLDAAGIDSILIVE